MNIQKRFHVFYGWYILAASFIILFFNGGARSTVGVIFKPMIEELGWSRSSISFAVFLNMVIFAISLIAVGRVYDRFGPKLVIIVSTIFISIGFMGIYTVNSRWQFFTFYGVLSAIGMSGTTMPIFSILVSKWFEKFKGLAISLALSGNGIGQFVLVPVFTFFVLRIGWRASYLWIGLVMLIVNICLALLFFKGDPDDLGLKPFGFKNLEKTGKKSAQDFKVINSIDIGLRDAVRTKSFWLFALINFFCGSGDFLVLTHLIPFVTDHGISPTTAGNMLAWYGLMTFFGMLAAGPISDFVGIKIPIAIKFFIRVMLFLIILKYHNQTVFYIFALTFGFTQLVMVPLIPILLGKLYGYSHIGLLSGFITTIHHLGGGFWVYMGGFIFDRTGSYQLAFLITAIISSIALVCTLFIKETGYHNYSLKTEKEAYI